jgi:hypothetical protein
MGIKIPEKMYYGTIEILNCILDIIRIDSPRSTYNFFRLSEKTRLSEGMAAFYKFVGKNYTVSKKEMQTNTEGGKVFCNLCYRKKRVYPTSK